MKKKKKKAIAFRQVEGVSERSRKAEEPKEAEGEGIKKIKIRLIGIGGGGSSIVSEIAPMVERASFFAADTDSKTLRGISRKVEKFQFGRNFTSGLGTGINPEMAKEAAISEKARIKKILEGQDLVILVACLGGGVGGGATPVFSKISRRMGNLTYGIFTLPFSFEGKRKMEIAKNSLNELKESLNAFSVIPNEKIFQIVARTTPLKQALFSINKILAESLQSLIEIIYKPGLINIDFADLKTILEGRGRLSFLNSIELPTVDNKEVIEKAVNSPLYPYNISGAKGVLLNISGQKNLSISQMSQISKSILERVSKEAKIIFGISQSKILKNVKVTIFATGCSPKFFVKKRREKLKSKTKTPQPHLSLMKKRKKKIKVKKRILKKEKKINLKSKKIQPEVKKEAEIIVRKNGLKIKEESEKEEKELLAKEKFWEMPAFLRKKEVKE